MVQFSEIIPYMDGVRNQLLEVLDSFGPDEKDLREVKEGWSVTEVIDHLGKIEAMIQYQLGKALVAEPILPSEPLSEKKTDVMDIVKESGIIEKKLESPAPARPSGQLSYEQAINKLNEIRAVSKQIIHQLGERNTNDLKYPHPAGFELNANQWAHFIAYHEIRHIGQLQRIRKANQ
ncbi:DinB family protein [Paenibacillus sp. Marseille-Q4541]|uniref:DinB family protein n=1 Tax=Paenibacillus sp. Marseille-Q4541 TaxID=2831522 RepID=UPI001BA8CC6A|nr:DinB family protein [Paenibacillus sp. Marseille-Q4541]